MNPQPDSKPGLVIRADASTRIGTGHLRRCATLARRLTRAGVRVHFLSKQEDLDPAAELGPGAGICAPLDPALQGEAEAAQTAAYCASVNADTLIVDHYHADEPYQRVLLEAGLRWLQFDGATGTTPLWANWVVSMSPAADAELYRPRLRRPQTRLLLGPRHAILRDEFMQWRAPRATKPKANRLLLTFGGADDRGACLACLEALLQTRLFEITVLGSSYNPNLSSIRSWIERNDRLRVDLVLDTPHVARRMTEADIALTAGGTTTFELAMLGLPALIVEIADNQRANAQAWERLGVAVNLGPLERLDPARLRQRLMALADDPQLRERMAARGRESVDGLGADRIVRELFPHLGKVS